MRYKDEAEINFQLKIIEECKTISNNYLNCIFSRSILLFYVPIFVVVIGIIIGLFV